MESRLLGFPAAEYRSLALRGGTWAREPSCPNMGTINGKYKKNLDELLSNLSKAAPKNGVFRTSTVGTGADQVRGSLMCFVDHEQTKCLDCLANTTAWISRTCPNSRTASASYDACLLQYSSPPFFDSAKHSDGSVMNITFMSFSPPFDGHVASMANARSRLFEEISRKASNQTLGFYNQSRLYTADKQIMRVYGLAQCSGDLAPGDCSRCISGYNGMLQRLFPNNDRGIVKGYNCYVRFQPNKINIFAEPMLPSSARSDPVLVLPPPPYSPPQGPLLPLPPPSYSYLRDQYSPVIVPVVVLIMLSMMAALWWIGRKAASCFWSFSVQEPIQNVQLTSRNLESQPIEDPPAQEGTLIPTKTLEVGPKEFSYQELVTATKDFSSKIGKGGFGEVYEGELGDMKVAIKKLLNPCKKSVAGFVAEATIISLLHHRNIVQYIGRCYHNNDLLLVYELVPKGSLDTHLRCASPVLKWSDRYKIALGMARALAYIHEDFNGDQFVLHKDIKPSNIMVGESFDPKLGDFGLARLVNHGESAHTRHMAGTFGYIDPHSHGKLSVQSDMYSFGVVLLEMGSGWRPSTQVMGVDGVVVDIHISDLLLKEYRRKAAFISVDPLLEGNFVRKQMHAMMHVGLRCVQSDLRRRPSAKEVIEVLLSAMSPDIPMNRPAPRYGRSVGGSPSTVNTGGASSDTRNNGAMPSAFPDSPSPAVIHPDPNSDRSAAALNNGGLSPGVTEQGDFSPVYKTKVGELDIGPSNVILDESFVVPEREHSGLSRGHDFNTEGSMPPALPDSPYSAVIHHDPNSDRSTAALNNGGLSPGVTEQGDFSPVYKTKVGELDIGPSNIILDESFVIPEQEHSGLSRGNGFNREGSMGSIPSAFPDSPSPAVIIHHDPNSDRSTEGLNNGGSSAEPSCELPTPQQKLVEIANLFSGGGTQRRGFSSVYKTKIEELINLFNDKKKLGKED